MDIIINNVVPCAVNIVVVFYVLSKLLNRKIAWGNYQIYLVFLILTVIAVGNFLFINDLIRIVVMTIFIGLANHFLFRESVKLTIISTILEQVILFLSEVFFAIILMLIIPVEKQEIFTGYAGTYITIISISVIAILLVNLKPVKKLCSKIMESFDRIDNSHMIMLTGSFVIVINVLLAAVYHEIDALSILLLNLFFLIIYSFILYRSLHDKNNALKMKDENTVLLYSLDEYEKMLDYQRVANHENKNQLLVIKSMLKNKNHEASKYIDEVIKDTKEDNEVLLSRTKKIPSGGLQGIIYQKMLLMNDKDIKVSLDVSNSIKGIKFNQINPKLNYDICRIIGVFLDNAIDEVVKLEEREVGISLYVQDDQLIIEIANSCEELPDLDKIDNKGYTTKDSGHGYGLSLVKDIINSSNQLENERTITKKIFTQILKIKM